ncbi:sensor histidine kinase [Anatilimnocola floriformis]|uniref:sensor histidine kinase n=1 Tax=Anatilimnocola floriformis TaxID=2948575 RepID=UPI0020C38895|nr:ATP-binding protein [Anatilimnocola floriformis]
MRRSLDFTFRNLIWNMSLEKEIAEAREENQQLHGDVQNYARQIEALREELAETNQGVVALYAELDNQANALREATALKSRFLSYMSHEFRTPLGSIRSIARLLLDRLDGELTPEQEKQIRFIDNSAIELTDMVNDLLDLARIEAGRVAISAEWFEMVDLFAALRGMFRPLLANSEVKLILEEPIDLPRIYTDNKKLSIILRNYISNSIKFTPTGEIRVSVGRIDDEQVQFSVSDTGIGIAPEFQHMIFEDFTQVDSPLQKKWRGSGLGLSLSKKLATLLGGSVSMTSEPNVGSIFSVVIPIQFAEEAPEGTNSAALPTRNET